MSATFVINLSKQGGDGLNIDKKITKGRTFPVNIATKNTLHMKISLSTKQSPKVHAQPSN